MTELAAQIGCTMPGRRCWALLLWLGVVSLTPTPAWGQQGPVSGSHAGADVLWHEAAALFPIRVHLPRDFDSARTYPTVIALHGFGSSSVQFERIGRAFAEGGFIAVLPEGPYPVPSPDSLRRSTWELSTWTREYGLGPPLSDDPAIEFQSASITLLEFLPSVIDRVREEYRVGSVYVFGFSLGGVYALSGGFYNRHEVDGIVAFGATFYRELFTVLGDRLEDGNHLLVRLALGRSDPMVPFSNAEEARDAFEEAGYEVILDEFPGGHTVPDDALRRAVIWLREVADRR
ncbi:MAG: alpha/beta hydrolase-fold protein [Gemmatimonadota bacterium]